MFSASDFLESLEVDAIHEGLVRRFSLTKEDILSFNTVEEIVALDGRSIEDLPTIIKEEVGTDDATAKKLAIEIAGRVLMQIPELKASVEKQLKVWGSDPDNFLFNGQIMTPENVVVRVLEDENALFEDEDLDPRLVSILAEFVNSKQDKATTKQILLQPVESGGVGISEVEADGLLAFFETEEIPSKENPLMSIEDFNKMILDAAAVMPIPKPKILDGKSTELLEEKDREDMQKAAEKAKVVHQHGQLLNVGDAIADIIKTSGVILSDEAVKKRFERIADARLRGVRDAYETRVQLEYPKEKGGLGFSGNTLADLSRVMEDVVVEYERDVVASLAKGKGALAEKKQNDTAEERETEKQNEQSMAKRYASMTGKAPKESVSPVAPSGARVSFAISAEQQVAAQESRINKDRVKQAVRVAAPLPPKAPASFSPQSVTPSGSRPAVDGVRFERRLAGPIEEIHALTLVEFRRLSRDPSEATTKILDKAHLLEEQGYDQRIAAVKAWRDSPLFRMFVDLSREALSSGKKVVDILKEKQEQRMDAPSDAEWKALFSLNAALRF